MIDIDSSLQHLLHAEASYRFIKHKITYFNRIICPTYKTIYFTISSLVFEKSDFET